MLGLAYIKNSLIDKLIIIGPKMEFGETILYTLTVLAN